MMTTRAFVEEKAREAELFKAAEESHARRNVAGLSLEEQVESRAQYTIARDRAFVAQQAYDSAFRQWQLSGFPD